MPIQAPRGVTQDSLGGLLPIPMGVTESSLFEALQALSEQLGRVFKAGPEAEQIITDQGSLRESAITDADLLKKLAKLFGGKTKEEIAQPAFQLSKEDVIGVDKPQLSRLPSIEKLTRELKSMTSDYRSLLQQLISKQQGGMQ